MKIVYGANYGRPTLDLNFARNKSLIDTISGQNLVTFTRSSTGTYVDSDGLIKYASANEPRFDHNPVTGESLGLLIEESRTNLVTYSEDFGNAAWDRYSSSVSIISNNSISPDGTTTANKIIPTTSSGFHLVRQTSVVGNNNLLSVYAKPAGYSWIVLAGWSGAAYFNISNGTIGTNSLSNASIQSLSNGWYRCSVFLGTQVSTGINIYIANIDNSPNFSGDGYSGVYLWGAQLEVGSFPTSYIPTGASTVTRSADTASITGTNFSRWYNQSEGTIFTRASSFSYNNSATLPTFAHFTDGTLNNYIRLNSGPSYLVRNFTNTVGVTQTQAGINIVPVNNTPYSIALGISNNNARLYANTNSGSTINPYLVPAVNKVEIGNWIAQNNTYLNGYISRLTYYPTRLQDYQLQQLTK